MNKTIFHYGAIIELTVGQGQGQCLPAIEDLFAGQFKVIVVRHLQKHLLLVADCFNLLDWLR